MNSNLGLKSKIWNSIFIISLAILSLLALTLIVMITRGYKVMSVNKVSDNLISPDELLIIRNIKINNGELVIFLDKINSNELVVGKINNYSQNSANVEVINNENINQFTVASSDIQGTISWQIPGIGKWLRWLGKPNHLIIGVIIPSIIIIFAEIENTIKNRYKNINYQSKTI
jgi:hypothetical protein